MKMRFEPAHGLAGELTAPPDKSISHRAALLGAMASEPVRIERFLHADDTTATLRALAADGTTTVGEPAQSRDHTERMLLAAGVGIHRHGRHVTVQNTDELLLHRVRVPGDVSSAAFLVTAGVLVAGSRLLIGDVGVNWSRTGFLRIVRRMRGIVLGDLEP